MRLGVGTQGGEVVDHAAAIGPLGQGGSVVVQDGRTVDVSLGEPNAVTSAQEIVIYLGGRRGNRAGTRRRRWGPGRLAGCSSWTRRWYRAVGAVMGVIMFMG